MWHSWSALVLLEHCLLGLHAEHLSELSELDLLLVAAAAALLLRPRSCCCSGVSEAASTAPRASACRCVFVANASTAAIASLALASLAAVAAVSTAVRATLAAVTAVASLASVAAAAAEIVSEVAASPSRLHIVAELALLAKPAEPSVAHVPAHGLLAGAWGEGEGCCCRCWSVVRRLLPHEADGLPVALVSLVLVAGALCPSLCQLILNHLRFRAHCCDPSRVSQVVLDAVRRVQASEHAASLRVVATGLLDGGHDARDLLVRFLVHASGRQLREQRLEARFHRRPALRRVPAERLEL